jgi:hypothetical protein
MKLPSKELQLTRWIQGQGIVATHEVIRWGVMNYYIRADRTLRQLRRGGLVEKLSEHEKAELGFTGKDAVYRWMGNGSRL